MRKLSSKEKQYLKKRIPIQLRHEQKRRIKRQKTRFFKQQQKVRQNTARNFDLHPEKTPHEKCIAPEVFSVLLETVGVVDYFMKARLAFENHLPVIFDLSSVQKMDTATLTLLCAYVNDEKFVKGNPLKGNIPRTPELIEMFKKSGFYNFVFSRVKSTGYIKDEYGELIHRVTRKKVESELAGKVCLSAVEHTFGGNSLKVQNLYKIIIECMANTWNHANQGREDQIYNWWLLAYKEKDTDVTRFCFLDLGVGVFGSLDPKYSSNNIAEWLKNLIVPDNHARTLEQIFQGKTKTSTNEPGRGKGINNIYNLVKNDDNIKDFHMITNNIVAKVGYNTPDTINTINGNFPGTLYYWELVPNHEQ